MLKCFVKFNLILPVYIIKSFVENPNSTKQAIVDTKPKIVIVSSLMHRREYLRISIPNTYSTK